MRGFSLAVFQLRLPQPHDVRDVIGGRSVPVEKVKMAHVWKHPCNSQVSINARPCKKSGRSIQEQQCEENCSQWAM